MVLEMAAMQRPRRLAATKVIQSESRADLLSAYKQTLSLVSTYIEVKTRNEIDQPKSGSLARRRSVPNRQQAASKQRSAATESSVVSSDAEQEQDDDGVDSVDYQSAMEESEEGSDSDGDDYVQSKKRQTRGKRNSTAPKAAKTKVAKIVASKASKANPAKRAKAAGGSSRGRKGGSKDELPINKDNKLFNSIQQSTHEDPRSVAEDWVSYYQDNQPAALAQFVNFVLRCCGCNATVDEVQVDDVDNAVETLEEVQTQFKEQNIAAYPLASRSSTYRRFRRSLSVLMEQIFSAASEADLLEDEMMVDRLLAWIATLSSSPYRAIRHTSTTFALMTTGQIARLNQEARKHFEQASKLRDAQKAAKASAARIKTLSEEVRQANARRAILDAYHKELDETVFIHRYRDSDPTIRADCMEELGRWMRLCPSQFLSGSYFKYLAWELSDESATVRLVVIQSLQYIFSRHQSSSALTLFVERVMPRMIEIAVGDVDVAVRVAMIQALLHLNQSGSIEDEEMQDQIARQIFDEEAKVRTAAARFACDVLEGKVEVEGGDNSEKLRFKVLGEHVHRWSTQVDSVLRQQTEDGTVTDSSLAADDLTSRIALAFSSLWTVSEDLRDWNPLLDLLQLDHTDAIAASAGPAKRGASKKRASDASTADTRLRLGAEEETVLIEVLVVMLQKLHAPAQPTKSAAAASEEVEKSVETMTRDLIFVLPGLFSKYKTEANRIANILLLPQYMKLGVYLEQQQLAQYEQLWDQVSDQFERHAEELVIERAASAMASLLGNTTLSATNEAKLCIVRESTTAAISDAVPSFSHLADLRRFKQDDLHKLTGDVIRLRALCRHFDLTADFEALEQEEDGTIWDIILSCAQRAAAEQEEENDLVKNALATCSLYIMWKAHGLLQEENLSDGKAAAAEALVTKRQAYLSLCERIIEMPTAVSSRFAVQSEALRQQIDSYILFANLAAMDEQRIATDPSYEIKLPVSLRLSCATSTQSGMASYVERIVKNFHETVQQESKDGTQDSLGFLRRQNAFVSDIAHFIGAIRIGIVDIRHSACLLANYGHLGHLFDACLRVLVEAIREVGINEHRGEVACRVILDALKQAHRLSDASGSDTDVNFVNFAKLLSSCLVVRGSHLSILRSIDGSAVIDMHERAIDWTLKQVRSNDEEEASTGGALSFFKGLSQLTISMLPRDALQVKAALQRKLTDLNINVPDPTSNKAWEALHSYEKRLVTIASKSDAVRRPSANPPAARNVTGPAEIDEQFDVPSSPLLDTAADRQRPRPRPRQTVLSTQDTASDIAPFGLTQQDESAVDSILGFADDTLPALAADGLDGFLSADEEAAFNLSQISGEESERQASQAVPTLFRGMADISQTQESNDRPSRRARPSRSMREEDDSEEEGGPRRKRGRRA